MKEEPRGKPAPDQQHPDVRDPREGGVDRAPERSDSRAGAGRSVQLDEEDARAVPRRIRRGRSDGVPPAQ